MKKLECFDVDFFKKMIMNNNKANCPQEIAQSVRITSNETEITSSNPPLIFCVDMSKNNNNNKANSNFITIQSRLLTYAYVFILRKINYVNIKMYISY